MPSLSKRLALFHRIVKREPSSVAAILAAAIPDAAPEEINAVGRAAVRTGRPSAVLTVIRHLHRAGSAGVEMFDEAACEPVARAIDVALRDDDEQVVANALDLIAHRTDPSLTRPLAGLISRPGPLGDRAADVLLSVTVAVVGINGRRCIRPEWRAELDLAVATAGAAWRRHRRGPVLVAAALLASAPGPVLAGLLADEDDPFTHALRGVGADDDPIVRRNLLRWLAHDTLGRACGRWLYAVGGGPGPTDGDFETLLADGHLLRSPRRRRALADVVRPFQCVPPIKLAAMLPDRLQTHVPTLVDRLDLSARARVGLRMDMIALPSPVARVRVVNGLLAERGARAAPALRQFCFDRHPTVARLAVHGVLRDTRGGGTGVDNGLLERLAGSGHRAVAVRASAHLVRGCTDAFFERWLCLPSVVLHAAAHRLLRAAGEAFVTRIRDELVGSRPRARVAAAALAKRLRLVPRLETELLALAVGDETRSASAAVAALTDGRTPERLDLLVESLDHVDPRVRANAIDALADNIAFFDHEPFVERLTPLVTNRHNRIRGNAIRAIVRCEPARGAADLHVMLSDRNPLHRVTAIWVVRSARVHGAGNHVRRLARSDRHAEVRHRALAATRLLGPAGARLASSETHP